MTRIVALEEHMVTTGLLAGWKASPAEAAERVVMLNSREPVGSKLLDVGAGRIADMDDQGVDVQVLSVTQPGVHNLAAADAIPLARSVNDAIAAAMTNYPDRLEGMATLPFSAPAAAADELRRTVSEHGFKGAMIFGRAGDRNADDRTHEPIWQAASQLRAPLYLHPQLPQRPVNDTYYSGISDKVDFALSSGAVGWHFETGIQLIRMIFSGVFDRNPDLQLIVGHWGELMLFWEERFTMVARSGLLPSGRNVIDCFREHVSFTGSGLTSDRYLGWAKDVVGIDRILFATDYPFIDNGGGRARAFLEDSSLTAEEKEQVGHGNWERLTDHLR